MNHLPEGYRAVVIGASGALGAAFVRQLQSDPRCGKVVAVSRQSQPGLDLWREDSMPVCAQALSAQGPFHLVIDATGALTWNARGPEKRLDELDGKQLLDVLQLNAVDPRCC
jgi:dTDP-4-dehydrorhamnose reductase